MNEKQINQQNAGGLTDNTYTIQILISESNFKFKSNVHGFTGVIDWGDGNRPAYYMSNDKPEHEYEKPGTYTVTHTGKCDRLDYYDENESAACLTNIIHIGGDMDIHKVDYAFVDCKRLAFLREDLFAKLLPLNGLLMTFCGCTSLKEIPEGLFAHSKTIWDFILTFSGCTSLTEIPEKLFYNCPQVTSFLGTFSGCSSLRSIPEKLFEQNKLSKSFDQTFELCISLTEIPDGLFRSCTLADSFNYTFHGCSALQSVPETLFHNNTMASSFICTFYGCKSLARIPKGLFQTCNRAEIFHGTFRQCSSLITIPADLFDFCTHISCLTETFSGCEKLTGESPYTVINGKKVHLYERKGHPAHFAVAPADIRSCFDGCYGLSDYGLMPAAYKQPIKND